jgi:hypothetical protein
MQKTLRFDGFNAHTDHFKSGAMKETMVLFSNVTGERMLSSQRGSHDVYREYVTHLNREKCRILDQIGHAYQVFTPPLFIVALLLFLYNFAVAVKKRRLPLMTVFSMASLAGISGITAVMTLLAITSYSEIARVMHVSFPLVLLFIISVFFDILGANTSLIKPLKNLNNSRHSR